MAEAIRGDAAQALGVEELLVPDLMVGEAHVLSPVELSGHRRLELVRERFGNSRGDASDVAVPEIKGESAVLTDADDAPNDERLVSEDEHEDEC
ncbi:MAG TPA: hypothetical protein VIP07_04225 [Candidatus Limnocylindria bacterium]